MNIIIKSSNHPLPDALRAVIEDKYATVSKLLPNSGGSDILEIEIKKVHEKRPGGGLFDVDVTLSVEGKVLYAKEESATLDGALEATRIELMQEVKKLRGRKRSILRRASTAMKSILQGSKE